MLVQVELNKTAEVREAAIRLVDEEKFDRKALLRTVTGQVPEKDFAKKCQGTAILLQNA